MPARKRLSGLQYVQVSVKQLEVLREMGMSFSNLKKTGKERFVILLDSGSSHHIFKDKQLFSKIWKTERSLDVETNGGPYTINEKGIVEGIGEVWYSPESMINILSLKLLNDHEDYEVEYSCGTEGAFFVAKNSESGAEFKFEEKDGVYIFVAEVEVADKTNPTQSYSLSNVATVEQNKKLYSKRQVKKAEKVKELIEAMGYPSRRDLIMMITERIIKDCPVTVNDVKRYFEIYGNNEGLVKGKTTRKRPDEVTTGNLVPIPSNVKLEHKNVTLCADLFFINNNPFLTTISKGLMYTTDELLPDRLFNTLADGIINVIGFYRSKGFNIEYVLTDGEFKVIRDVILDEANTDLNTAAPNEHIPEVEKNIRTIKDRVRCTLHGMPYKKIPRSMKAELVITTVTLLNMIPRRAAVSDRFFPRELVTGMSLEYKKHLKTTPGKYCLVHEDNIRTNTMAPRATRALAIGPDFNLQGSYRFYLLDSGKIVTRRNWDEMVVTADIIAKIEEVARDEDDMEVEFEYHGTIITTENKEEKNDDEDEGDIVIQQQPEQVQPAARDEGVEDADPLDPFEDEEQGAREENPAEEHAPALSDRAQRMLRRQRLRDAQAEARMPERKETGSNAFLRPKAEKQFEPDHFIGKVYAQMISRKHEQLNLKEGLRRFGEDGKAAVKKEIKSFQDFDVLAPLLEKELSEREKWEALPLMMTVKRSETEQ